MLSLSTVIRLSAFFLVIVSGLFIDQLFVGRIRLLAKHVITYEVTFILLIAVRRFHPYSHLANAYLCTVHGSLGRCSKYSPECP